MQGLPAYDTHGTPQPAPVRITMRPSAGGVALGNGLPDLMPGETRDVPYFITVRLPPVGGRVARRHKTDAIACAIASPLGMIAGRRD